MKKIILTADDLGINIETNRAIAQAYEAGTLTTSCLLSNFEAFDDAIETVVKMYPELDLGVHLNIIEGKSLCFNEKTYITDSRGNFKLKYHEMLMLSENKEFLKQVEIEFRAQMDRILSRGIKPSYINSHVHVHSIPKIFDLVCRLANEYGLKNIRTQAELPYYTVGLKRHLDVAYCLNIVKNILLNTFSIINKKIADKYGLITNDNFIGVLYTGKMDCDTMLCGINRLSKDGNAEIILHPTINENKKHNYIEYKSLINPSFKEKLNKNNIRLITWKEWENLKS